jgi:hypothetical protein
MRHLHNKLVRYGMHLPLFETTFHSDMLILFHTVFTFMCTMNSNLPLHLLFLLVCQFCFLKMTWKTKPLHKAISSVPNTTPATPGVVSPMAHVAKSKKRKLTLQADKQKQQRMKNSTLHIESSTTRITKPGGEVCCQRCVLYCFVCIRKMF